MKFSDLSIEKNILRALKEVGYDAPTPIQEQAIPALLEGRDVLACAQTGTGKTCAFAIPIIQNLEQNKTKDISIKALILTPTRELALQIYENVCSYARYTRITSAVVFGGVSQVPQVDAIKRGVDILIATPGRLWDLMNQKVVKLDTVSFFVLDEADRMLDMGFFPDVKRIIRFLPKKRQTLLFSATIPKEIASLADSLLENPVKLSITPSAKPVEKIEQQVYFVEKAAKRELLAQIIRQKNVHQTLVFTRTKHGADRVTRDLIRAGVKARAIHGDKTQNQRQTALRDFKNCRIAVLVATDIAARGIDISDLPLVVNYDLPNIPETYVHRIGRTGRAGQEGTAISFCDASERLYLADIEGTTGVKITAMNPGEDTWKLPADLKQEIHKPARPNRIDGKVYASRKPASNSRGKNTRVQQASRILEKTEPIKPKASKTMGKRTPLAQNEKRTPRVYQKKTEVRKETAHSDILTTNTIEPRKNAEKTNNRPMRTRTNAKPQRGRTQRGGRMNRFEQNEPRYDAHTPTRKTAMSEEAAERIRKKVEAALNAQKNKSEDRKKVSPKREINPRNTGRIPRKPRKD